MDDDFEVETAESNDSDVNDALANQDTADGKGDQEPGESDFDSFATEGVENPAEGD